MKKIYQVLFISEPLNPLLPTLEKLFESHPETKIRFIAPAHIYKTDLTESDFILLDYDFYLKSPESLKMVMSHLDKLSIFATHTDHLEMNEVLKNTKVSHFFGMSGTHTVNDIRHHLIAEIEQKFWTPETLITPPITKRSKTIFPHSDHVDEQIEKSFLHHDLSHTFEGFKPILIQILNEALTNALFNAPVDANGKFLHRHQTRREVVHAESGKEPSLEIVEDAEKIILSVRDHYGTLTKEVVDHYLTHGKVAEKDGGAGVGIYLILKHAHKLVINLDPGKMTEFMIVLHKFKRFFHYQTLEKSYHLYQRKSP